MLKQLVYSGVRDGAASIQIRINQGHLDCKCVTKCTSATILASSVEISAQFEKLPFRRGRGVWRREAK